MSDRSAAGQRAPAMAEERRLVRGRVHVQNADGADAGGGEPGGAVAGKVELPVRLPASRGEEARRVPGSLRQDRVAEIRRRPRRSPGRCRVRSPRRSRRDRRRDRTMAATVASITPATAPRQPAWAAPATPASRVGQQDGRAVGGDDAESDIRAGRSPWRRRAGRCPGATVSSPRTTSAPCTCIRPTRRSGSAPIARAARARFSSTASRASPPDRLQLRLA